jgi:hypothetical protein
VRFSCLVRWFWWCLLGLLLPDNEAVIALQCNHHCQTGESIRTGLHFFQTAICINEFSVFLHAVEAMILRYTSSMNRPVQNFFQSVSVVHLLPQQPWEFQFQFEIPNFSHGVVHFEWFSTTAASLPRGMGAQNSLTSRHPYKSWTFISDTSGSNLRFLVHVSWINRDTSR